MENFKKLTMYDENIKTTASNSTDPLLGLDNVSCSTDKLMFLYEAIKKRKEIAAHIFNDVFAEFEDTFYKGKPYKNAIVNFKKYMKLAAENKGHEVVVLPAKNNGIVHGIKNLWSIRYCN